MYKLICTYLMTSEILKFFTYFITSNNNLGTQKPKCPRAESVLVSARRLNPPLAVLIGYFFGHLI